MTRAVPRHMDPVEVHAAKRRLFETDYGYFSADGGEYVITRPNTPRPWVNVICPGDYGLIVSQAGGGYSWKTHAGLNRLTRWSQDLIADTSGKFIYLRDEECDEGNDSFWSATWGPVCVQPDAYECRHGLGYTIFTQRVRGIETRLTMFVPPGESLEVWQLDVENVGDRPRRLTAWSYLEWCLGISPDDHREFHKTFIETESDGKLGACLARKRLWDIANARGQHWNRSWEGLAWHAVSETPRAMSGDKQAFVGAYGDVRAPAALRDGEYKGETTGRWDDASASLCVALSLAPGEARTLVYTLGVAPDPSQASRRIARYRTVDIAQQALRNTKQFWRDKIKPTSVTTPDKSVDILVNQWLKYQTLSSRLWGRTAYYQAGGAYGYRDQLQDSQIFLHLDPPAARKQILLHAAHQYEAGHVMHWWHPITEQGMESRYSDDLLWLPFVTIDYLKETGDWKVLATEAPFVDQNNGKRNGTSLYEHCTRAMDLALSRRSDRGLPLIGTGDWNDGLSVAGWDGRGESVWVGMFLYRILNEFLEMAHRAIESGVVAEQERSRLDRYRADARELYQAVNEHGWDGRWYWAASCDDGSLIGSHRGKEGRIHLNPQTWAVLSGIVPEDRLPRLLESVERYLYRDYGPLVLHPAYTRPDERIGYLTRYAPGVRENGGLYSHAAMWAIQMECQLKRADKAWELFRRLCPMVRGMNPQLYQCEPYVTPGNVDGPDSPHFGRGGWTWYTGSSGWLYRVLMEWVMGVRPTWEGLLIDPCPPSHWDGFTMRRRYRDCDYEIEVKRLVERSTSDNHRGTHVSMITVDGRRIDSHVIRHEPGVKARKVQVILGEGTDDDG